MREPGRQLAVPPQSALMIGPDAAWLAAADLLSRDMPVVIIDPSGRFGAVAERRGAVTVTAPSAAPNPAPPALHLDLSDLAASERGAAMRFALENVIGHARPDQPLLLVVDDADELFSEPISETLKRLTRPGSGVIARLVTTHPEPLLDGGGAEIIHALAIKLIGVTGPAVLSALESAGLITSAEADRLAGGGEGDMLVLRDGDRSFLRTHWLLEHPEHQELLRALAGGA
jgi:hypothetical protein